MPETVLPATLEELTALIDERIVADRRLQAALLDRQDRMHARHAEIDRDAKLRKAEETSACTADLRIIHERAGSKLPRSGFRSPFVSPLQ
ncbi:MAG: hypothetical protein P8Y48_18635 [Novosphingobium sp.]